MANLLPTRNPGYQPPYRYAAKLLFLTLAYFVSGRLGLAIPYVDSHITLIWLPSGIAVAALLRWGYICWPGIFLGALATNFPIDSSPLLDSGIALGNTLGPLLAAWLLRQLKFHAALDRAYDILLLVLAAAVGMLVSASGGAINLVMFNVVPMTDIAPAWLSWWAGDFVGVLLAAPLLLNVSRAELAKLSAQRVEFTAWCLTMLAMGWGVFFFNNDAYGYSQPLVFLLVPVVVWAAMRFGMMGSSLGVLLAVLIAALATGHGLGPFHTEGSRQGLLLLWLFFFTLVLVELMVAVLQAGFKASNARVLRLVNLYAALNQCNQAIVRCTSEDELFQQVCRDAVQSGGMRMAWVGMMDEASRGVKPVASYGTGVEYLDGIQISANADEPAGRGTTGTAIREDRPVWIQDFQNDPRLVPWHERGARYGWAGVAALPLHRNGAVIGALMLYAAVTDAFDEAARNLLEGMTADIGLALDRFASDDKRKQAEDALRESEARTRLILDMAMDAVISADQEGTVIGWNREAERMFGYTADYALGKDLAELIVPPIHRQAHRQGIQRFVKTGSGTIIGKRIEITGMRADSSEIPVELTLASVLRNGRYYFNAFVRDITERKKVEEDLRITAATFDTQEAILITDRDANILRVNRAFEEVTGYAATEVIGENPRIFQSGRHDAAFYRAMWSALSDTGKWSGEVWDKRRNGEIYPKMMTITAVYDNNQQVTHYVAVSRDITRRKQSEQEIHQLAFYDPLTSLPNRRLLQDRLQQSTAVSARNGRHGALIFLDLDNFKAINDTQGHAVGDRLLIEVARRLQLCVREGDTVARLGGDEFVVVLEDLSNGTDDAATQAEQVAEKIQRELGQAYVLNDFECISTASIGISLFLGHRESLDDLLKHADTAMYQAKTAGRNTIRFYDPAMQAALEARIELEGELRQALNKQQLRLYYQVQVDHLQRPLGAEVLLRWEHPKRGLVSPAEFIPLSEETGLIMPIGLWVLQTACEQLRAWQYDALTRDLTLAVNVSAKQFRQADFVQRVQLVLQESGAKPSLLKLELTESTVLENVEDTIGKMHQLKIFGVGFSMDDFGTGYSSLQYLKRLPLDQIKIDQSFVRDIASDPNDAAIVKTIIAMTDALGLGVIAEGVETEAQREFLEKHGCHAFQGYLFSKPVPVGLFETMLRGG